jgi:hypothetical protein
MRYGYIILILFLLGLGTQSIQAQPPRHKRKMVLIQPSGDTQCDENGEVKQKGKKQKHGLRVRRNAARCPEF